MGSRSLTHASVGPTRTTVLSTQCIKDDEQILPICRFALSLSISAGFKLEATQESPAAMSADAGTVITQAPAIETTNCRLTRRRFDRPSGVACLA